MTQDFQGRVIDPGGQEQDVGAKGKVVRGLSGEALISQELGHVRGSVVQRGLPSTSDREHVLIHIGGHQCWDCLAELLGSGSFVPLGSGCKLRLQAAGP